MEFLSKTVILFILFFSSTVLGQIDIQDRNLDKILFEKTNYSNAQRSNQFVGRAMLYSLDLKEVEEDLKDSSSVIDSLISLYKNTGGPNWTNKTGWEDGVAGYDYNYCDWYGINCNLNEEITSINLGQNNLIGTLNNSIDQFNKLEKFDVFNNDLTGTIPDMWTNMLDVKYLDFGRNSFSGPLPQSLNLLTDLETFYGDNNSFIGDLPESFGTFSNLNTFHLNDNDFSGFFPSGYYSLCNRESVDLTSNFGLPSSGNLTQFCQDFAGSD